MDLDIQLPTEYELRQQCETAIVRVLGEIDDQESVAPDAEGKDTKIKERIRISGILKESTVSGAQHGATMRYRQIDGLLNTVKVSRVLDKTFGFDKVMYQDNVIPPVITETKGSVNLAEDRQSAETTAESWTIIKPARITNGSLSWRTYLSLDFVALSDPRPVNPYYAPRSRNERDAWEKGFCGGFKAGYRQANNLFMRQLSDLKRDYLGMLKFVRFEQQGIVSAPTIEETRMGTLVQPKRVELDKRDVRITQSVEFRTTGKWNNLLIKQD